MKVKSLCRGLALLAVMTAGFAHAQDYSLNDAISGQTIPIVYKPANVPADFKAVKITQVGPTQVMPSSTSADSAMQNDMFMEILPISWTNGQTISIAGQSFLVTYGIDLGPSTMKAMSSMKKLQPFSLRLRLIKTSEISSITPMPEWTKTRYMRAIAQVTVEAPTRLAANTPILPATKTMPKVQPIAKPAPTTVAISEQPTNTAIEIPPPTTATTPTPMVTTTTTPEANVTPAPEKTPTAIVKGVSTERPVDAALYQQAQDNAKSIASAMLVYAQDYDGTFPYVQSSRGAAYVIYPYVKGTNVYQTMNPVRGGEFRFNMSLAGVKMADITDPANTPLFYDAYAWPNSTYLVSFADSHVKFLTPEQWEKVKKNLALKLKRNGKPMPADLGLSENAGTPAPTATTSPNTTAPAPSTEGTTSPPTPGTGGGN